MYWLMRSASWPPVSVVSPRKSTGLSLLRLRAPTVRWPAWRGWRSRSSDERSRVGVPPARRAGGESSTRVIQHRLERVTETLVLALGIRRSGYLGDPPRRRAEAVFQQAATSHLLLRKPLRRSTHRPAAFRAWSATFWARSARHWISFLIHGLSRSNSSVSDTRRTSSLTPVPSGHFCAHCLASSFDDTSRIQNPLNSSLASVYGPSVTTGGSELKSTTKPSSGPVRPSPASITPALMSSSL